MQRRGQAILDHPLRIEMCEGRMELSEIIDVFHHCPHDLIDHLFRLIGAGHEGRNHAERHDIGIGGAIRSLGNCRERILGILR